MAEWKECLLSDLGTVVGGATPSTKNPANYEGGTISWITPKDLADFKGRYIARGERMITDAGLSRQNNQTTTSDFPCNFNFTVSNMNRFNQGIDHG